MLLSEEQQLVRDTMRSFAERELAPNAARWDRESHFPREQLRALGELGAMGMVVPDLWNGAGMDYVSLAVALEEIAAGDGATSTIVSVQNSVVCGPINAYGTDAQKEKYLKPLARGEWLGCFCLTEPHVGSDAGAITTRAERRGDRYVLNGVKQFITTGANADVAVVFAVTDKAAGKKGFPDSSWTPSRRAMSLRASRKNSASTHPTRRNSCSRIAKCRRKTCWARKARATASPCPTSRPAASASRRRRSAWRARRSTPASSMHANE
jgi:hypothetical protein